MTGVYEILNVVSGKLYIGSSVNIRTRLRHHRNTLNAGVHRNQHLQHAYKKYGLDAFEFFPIEYCEAIKEDLEAKEQFWIDALDACNPAKGYNVCPIAGSCLGRKLSPEARARISLASKAVWATDEHRKKMSDAHVGQVAWNAGKKLVPLSAEHRQKISEANKGKVKSAEACRKLSEANKGKTHTPEARRKMSEAAKGRIVSAETRKKQSEARMGHPVSEETRRKLSIAHKGKVISEETRQKISAKLTGVKRGPCSEETKRKIGDANRGRMPVNGFKKGHQHSPERLAQISASLKGKAPNSGSFRKGHKQSPEMRKKKSEAAKRYWAKKRQEKHNGG